MSDQSETSPAPGRKQRSGRRRLLTLNGGMKTLEVAGGESLLASLRREGILVPSACGGRGMCAYCKLKVTAGGGPVAPTEAALLSAEELAEGFRLSCQVKLRGDLACEIPPELLGVRQYRGRIEQVRDLTADMKLLRIALADGKTIAFAPGQYVQLEAPAYGDNPEPVYRAYSIASPPADTRHVELIVRLVPGGICTTWVFTVLGEGDEVSFNGPCGEFRLSDSDAPMAWIAGGSGMAPFWSMIRHMAEEGIARPCTYFFGAVRKADMFFLDELRAMAKELPWFRFVPALSAPDPSGAWDGETGLITEVVDRHVKSPDVEGYLCGSSGMIDAAVKTLRGKGVPPERIFYDKFN